MEFQHAKPFDYLKLGTHFLLLAELGYRQVIASGNEPGEIFDIPPGPFDWETSVKEFFERTQWVNRGVGIPLLFNFYHGIELILKGFLAGSSSPPAHHKLSQLLTSFKGSFPSDGAGLANAVVPFVNEIDNASPLGNFLSKNQISIDDWYEALKYPASTKGMRFAHTPLTWEIIEDRLTFPKFIEAGAAEIRKQAVELAKEIEYDS